MLYLREFQTSYFQVTADNNHFVPSTRKKSLAPLTAALSILPKEVFFPNHTRELTRDNRATRWWFGKSNKYRTKRVWDK